MSIDTSKPTICVDTNIIVFLEALESKRFDKVEKWGDRFGGEMVILYTQLKSGEANLVIPPTVYREIANGKAKNELVNQMKFVKDNNFFICEFNEETTAMFVKRRFEVAVGYSKELTLEQKDKIATKHGVDEDKITSCVFEPLSKVGVDVIPQRDALIMAESALLGLPLLTANYSDFLWDNRGKAIEMLNKEMGLSTNAQPFSAEFYLKKLQNKSNALYFNGSKLLLQNAKPIQKENTLNA